MLARAFCIAFVVLGCAHPRSSTAPAASPSSAASPTEELRRLLATCDHDRDGRITVRDEAGGPLRFTAATSEGPVELHGAERLAHLSDLLVQAADAGPATPGGLSRAQLQAPRSQIVRELVRRSWKPLTRRADRLSDLLGALGQVRLRPSDGRFHVFYPETDPEAGARLLAEVKTLGRTDVAVTALPRRLEKAWLERLDQQPGLLYLPWPYIVPGGHFNEMYGWDSYFMARGALADGELDLAAGMLDDLVYQVIHYGKIGNSNRSIHRGRTQPPFLPSLALAVAAALPAGARRDATLRAAADASGLERTEVWLAAPRATELGLSRYRDESEGPLPEVRPALYKHWSDEPEFRAHQRAVRESGWDMTHRFGTRGHQVIPVCLNALLFRFERDLAEIHRQLEGAASPEAARLEAAAEQRRQRIDQYLWDEKRGLYFDWDPERNARSDYEHVGSLYMLWAGAASPAQARRVVENLALFEAPGGLAVSSERSRRAAGGEDLQWDWPAGWAPHQVLAVEGLRQYGFEAEASRISRAWLSMVLAVAAAHDGLIKEKYDVVARSADVPAEYGNQGGDRGSLARYPATCASQPTPDCVRLMLAETSHRPIGFGWTNASISLLLDGLSHQERAALDAAAR